MTGCLAEALLKVAFLVLLLPVMLLVSTPFILALALLEPSRYLESVRERYAKVFGAWLFIVSHGG